MEIIHSRQFNLSLAILSSVLFVHFFKIATKTWKNDGAMTILIQIISGISVLLLIPCFKIQFPTDRKLWWCLGIAILFYTINDRLHTTTRKHLDVSTENITRQFTKVLLMIAWIIFFKEDVVIIKLLGGLLIILSNVLLLMKRNGKFVWNKYLFLQLISVVAFTIAFLLDVGISTQFNLPIYISITLLVPALLIFFIEKIPYNKIITEYQQGNRIAIFITGLCWWLSCFFGIRAYQLGIITTIAPLSSLSILINIILAYLFLGEKENIVKKFITVIGIIIGIILIT